MVIRRRSDAARGAKGGRKAKTATPFKVVRPPQTSVGSSGLVAQMCELNDSPYDSFKLFDNDTLVMSVTYPKGQTMKVVSILKRVGVQIES